MSITELDNLVSIAQLKVELPDQSEFDALVQSGVNRLKDAQITSLNMESQFDLAYNAAHAFSLAAMRWHGYRPQNNRFTVFQSLQHTIGLSPPEGRVLIAAHSKRNLAEYEGQINIEKSFVIELVRVTEKVAKMVSELGPILTK